VVTDRITPRKNRGVPRHNPQLGLQGVRDKFFLYVRGGGRKDKGKCYHRKEEENRYIQLAPKGRLFLTKGKERGRTTFILTKPLEKKGGGWGKETPLILYKKVGEVRTRSVHQTKNEGEDSCAYAGGKGILLII